MITAGVCIDPALRDPAAQRVAAHRLLDHTLADRLGVPVAGRRLLRNSFGRPSLPGPRPLQVSLAHCEGAVVAAACTGRIGVDVERCRPPDEFAGRRMLSPVELDRLATAADPDREFFRCWTLKESYVKALGVGLSYRVRRLVVSVAADGTASLNRPGARVRLDERFEGYVLAFCTLDGETDDPLDRLERVDFELLEERA